MENFTINDNEYRIKRMNAIELLALRSQISFDNYEETKNFYNLLLEKFEVKCGKEWLQVKDGENYYPAGIENDIELIDTLIAKMMEYLKSVFQKSNASKA